MSDDTGREVAGILLDINAVSFRLDPPFKYASGIVSPIYTDCRLLISHPRERRRVIELMAESVESMVGGDYVIAGEGGSIPHAAWLAEKLDKPMVYVRKTSKDHGKENLVEGLLQEGSKVLVVEDLVSTGGSSIKTVDKIRAAGGLVSDCASIFTYRLAAAEENFSKAKVRLRALCDFETALDLAVERECISRKEGESARIWRENPGEWGK